MSRLLVACLLLALAAPVAAQGDEARAVDERGVVSLVSRHSPTLKAALLELESSQQAVAQYDAQYTPVVLLDASASQLSTPTLFSTGVSLNRQRRVDAGAELRKHLLWGTDLALRVAGNVQETYFRRPSLTNQLPGIVPGNITGSLNTLSPVGSFGPGYGVLGKLTLKQPLLRGRGRDVAEAELNAARSQRTAAQYARDRVASEQLRDALRAYWELWYAGVALEIQEQARDVAKRQRDEAQARVDSGGLAPVEVLTFDTQVATREEDIAAAAAEQRRAELELRRLVGLAEQPQPLAVADGAPSEAVIAPRAALEERALHESAELRERAAAVELARIRARTASDPLRQRLDLDAYAQAQGLGNESASDAFNQFGNMKAVSAFVGLTYEAPVQRRAERAAAAQARIAVDSAEQQLNEARQRLLSDLGKALEQTSAQRRRVELAEQTQSIAERQLVAEQARFRTGASTALEVLVAEDRLRNARLRVTRARADLVQSGLSLDHMTGQLLARFGNAARD
jgi:outer membrane protein TolC